MPLQTINVGAAVDDGTGDPIRTAFQKINTMFGELYGGMRPRYRIATADAPAAIRASADLDLSTVGAGNVSSALATAFGIYGSWCSVQGPTVQLDGSTGVIVTGVNVDIEATDTVFTLPSGLATAGNTRQAGLKFRGTTTTYLTNTQVTGASLVKGARTITRVTPTGSPLPPGTRLHIKTTQNGNVNRAAQYYDAEENQVLVDDGTTITCAYSFKSTYTIASGFEIRTLSMIQPRIKGVRVAAHPSATVRQELMVVQYAQNSVLDDCAWTGAAAMHGLGLWGTVDDFLVNCYVEDINDANNTVGWEGYGVMSNGSRTVVQNLRGYRCRHQYDMGCGGSAEWWMPRDHVLVNCSGRHALAAAFSNHGGDGFYVVDSTAYGSGSSVMSRGGKTVVRGGRYESSHADVESFYGGNTQSTTDLLTFGEPDLNSGGTALTTQRSGPAGTQLVIDRPVLIAPGPSGAGVPTVHGVRVRDPLASADITLREVLVSGWAVYADGDTIERTNIDVTIDGSGQFSGQGGVYLVPGTNTGSTPQYVKDVDVRVHGRNLRGPALQVGGGTNGGITDNVRIRLDLPNLGTGRTATDAPIVIGAGAVGNVAIVGLNLPATNRGSWLSDSSTGSLITYLPGRNVFADAATDQYKARLRARPNTAQFQVVENTAAGSNLTMATGDRTQLRLIPLWIADVLMDAIGVGTAGTAVVLGSAAYARVRVGLYADNGNGSAPATGAGSLLATLGDIDVTGAVGPKTLVLGSAFWDSARDAKGSGRLWLGAAYQSDVDPTTFPTFTVLSGVLLQGPTDLSAPTVRGYTATVTSGAALADLGTISRDGTARIVAGLRAA